MGWGLDWIFGAFRREHWRWEEGRDGNDRSYEYSGVRGGFFSFQILAGSLCFHDTSRGRNFEFKFISYAHIDSVAEKLCSCHEIYYYHQKKLDLKSSGILLYHDCPLR